MRLVGIVLGNPAGYDHYGAGEMPVPAQGSAVIAKELMMSAAGQFTAEVVVADDQGVDHTLSAVGEVRAP